MAVTGMALLSSLSPPDSLHKAPQTEITETEAVWVGNEKWDTSRELPVVRQHVEPLTGSKGGRSLPQQNTTVSQSNA